MNTKIKFIARAAIIAALYAVSTIALGPIGSGIMQVRASEALTVLPFFTTAAIPGLFAGCIVANMVTGMGPWDVLFGSLATLLAAFLTYKMPNKYLAPLPPVIVNALVVGTTLGFVLNTPHWIAISLVGLGELISCYAIGYPLLLLLEKFKSRLFS
ncbi:MAG: QueT transporter family protein [Clostridia bacterium]|nr:QueT transporter family protein [Clostridia bacterium]